jgi:hypothetical protein
MNDQPRPLLPAASKLDGVLSLPVVPLYSTGNRSFPVPCFLLVEDDDTGQTLVRFGIRNPNHDRSDDLARPHLL